MCVGGSQLSLSARLAVSCAWVPPPITHSHEATQPHITLVRLACATVHDTHLTSWCFFLGLLFCCASRTEVGWLVSLLTRSVMRRREDALPPAELDAMVAQVQQIFPNVETSMISADLQLTQSVQITSENIVEGRLGLHT